MNTTLLIQTAAIAAFAFSTASASAAPLQTVKLPRVVITGKAAPQVVQLPTVYVTGSTIREVAQLPRVVIHGNNDATLLRQQSLAAATPAAKRV